MLSAKQKTWFEIWAGWLGWYSGRSAHQIKI